MTVETNPNSPVAPADLQEKLERLQARHQRLFEQLQMDQRRFQSLARSVWRVQEDERRRLARELHDGIGQNLTALKNQLGHMIQGLDPEQAEALQRAHDLCASCLADTRELSRLLRPPILDDLGLVPALQVLTRTAGERVEMGIELIEQGVPEGLDRDLSTLVYRLAQEALTNAIKHSGGDHILLRLSTVGGALRLLVVDNGSGFDVRAALAGNERERSFGLHGMRERVSLFGGEFDVHSAPGEGTSIRAVLPLPEEARQ